MRTLGALILTAAVAAATLVEGYGLDLGALRWAASRVVFQSYFDTSEAQRSVANALRNWRTPVDGVLELDAHGAAGEAAVGNGVNELAWEDLPPEVVSLTWIVSRSGRIIEADVSVDRDQNDSAGWSMDAVLTHELGHTLGLGHADEGGTTVRAAMAASAANQSTTLTSDDHAAIVEVYRRHDLTAAPGPDWRAQDVAFPPRNEPFAFRQQLELVYRDVLRRPSILSFVDIEGNIVWTQEYLRYRVNGCGHLDAQSRVFSQIEGRGIQPVCTDFTGTTVVFPPRNEPFAFRQQLEVVYRDTLRRPAQQTFVDNEGDIVWTQEYLRYRVNGCSNSQAIERVFTQLNGGPVQPVCTGQPPAGPAITGYISGVSAGNIQAALAGGARPGPGSGPSVTVTGNTTVINGGANQVRLQAPTPFDSVIVSVETTPAALRLSPLATAEAYYVLRLPAATTIADLTIVLPAQVAGLRFGIEYAVGNGGANFGPYRQQIVQVTTVGTGDVQISVSWNSDADVDLHVVEPNGTEIYYGNDQSPSGGELDLDSNAACFTDNIRNENIRWPSGRAPSGTYIVRVDYWDACGVGSTSYTVRIINGSSSQVFTGTFTGSGDQGGAGSGREITRFTR